jgi:hypothetical protein
MNVNELVVWHQTNMPEDISYRKQHLFRHALLSHMLNRVKMSPGVSTLSVQLLVRAFVQWHILHNNITKLNIHLQLSYSYKPVCGDKSIVFLQWRTNQPQGVCDKINNLNIK